MIFTATKESRLFGGCNCGLMDVAPLLGASRTYDPTYPYDFVKERYPIPYTRAGIAAIIGDLDTEPKRQGATIAVLNQRITQLHAAIAALEQFDRDNTSYYGERVSRTSGGKRDRLRDERAALREEGELARKLATSAIQALTTSVNAKASAAMQDSGTSTGNIIVSRDEDTGALVYSRKYTPVATVAPVSQGNNLPPWLLPAGVGLAAILALKG